MGSSSSSSRRRRRRRRELFPASPVNRSILVDVRVHHVGGKRKFTERSSGEEEQEDGRTRGTRNTKGRRRTGKRSKQRGVGGQREQGAGGGEGGGAGAGGRRSRPLSRPCGGRRGRWHV
eukprot:754610-Hanusia_phi.AAC.1